MKKIKLFWWVCIGLFSVVQIGWAELDTVLTAEKIFVIRMMHGADRISNEKIDICFPENERFWGSLIIEVTGGFNYQNTSGKYTKEYGLGLNQNGLIYSNETQVTSNLGPITDNVYLTPVKWDPDKKRYFITFVHQVPTSNRWVVKIKAMAFSEEFINNFNNMTLSEYYTTDSTSYPDDQWNVNENTLVVNKEKKSVGIGTTDPGPYRLAVEGKIGAREIVVTDVNPWADYVFKDDYILRPLAEVESFIRENKHLPEVPSAEEIKDKGLNMSEMMAIQMKKIEELTLHVIEQEKGMTMLRLENEGLKDRLMAVENGLTRAE
ncbi:hypothetical protein JCM14469_24330 [Desulfatiferula olefinivorans]